MTADLGDGLMRGCLSPPCSAWRDVKSEGTVRTLEEGVTGEAVVPSPSLLHLAASNWS